MSKRRKFLNLFTEFEFDEFTENSGIENSRKLDYIKEMIALAKSDKQAVLMYLAFDLATIAFLIDKVDASIRELGFTSILLFYGGITLLGSSAVFFFTYWRKIHRCHINLVSCIPNLNIIKTRDLWLQLWSENKHYFKLGLLLLSVGIVILLSVTIASKIYS